MSVAYVSFQSTVPVTTTSFVITKPTSLTVGDLMLAQITAFSSGSTVINLPTNWVSVLIQANGNMLNRIMYKIADSADVAATNFTFTGSGTGVLMGGAIMRITGYGPAAVVEASNSTTWSGTSANLAIGITPARGNDLLFIFVGVASSNPNGTISAQAIATSDPGFTEIYDFDSSESADINRIAAAYAVRPETTSTGNVSFTTAQAATGGVAAIVAIYNSLDVTIAADVTTAPATVPDATPSGGGTVSAGVIQVTASVIDPSQKGQATWSNQQRNTTTWSNQTKS